LELHVLVGTCIVPFYMCVCILWNVHYLLFIAQCNHSSFMEMECGIRLWSFKDPFSLELHCAKCNDVVICNVLVISKSLVMVFDLLFIVWVFCLMWLVGICDGLWVWTKCYCKWVKFFFFFLKLGFNTPRSLFFFFGSL
jgi:hypothetical protein